MEKKIVKFILQTPKFFWPFCLIDASDMLGVSLGCMARCWGSGEGAGRGYGGWLWVGLRQW